MSAYGTIQRLAQPSSLLPSTIWYTPAKNISSPAKPRFITIHHLTLPAATALPGLLATLYKEFEDEIVRGNTYPHEDNVPMTRDTFETYFFAVDVFVGVIGVNAELGSEALLRADGTAKTRFAGGVTVREVDVSADAARAGRDWGECIAGFYYIKPNYPGRSSHICNGGIIIPHAQRNAGFGGLFGRSFIHYAPALGYRASIFNLVYVNNHASVRLWESLNFTKVGRIPRAGRLRRMDGQGEEYVDAWVFYKDFYHAEDGEVGAEVEVEVSRRTIES